MTLALLVVWIHFVGDFIFQTDKMATGKANKFEWLFLHVATYTLFLLLFGIKYAVINGVCHFAVDFFTSKATKWAWAKEKRHLFFTIVGFDQALHLTCLLLTLPFSKPLFF